MTKEMKIVEMSFAANTLLAAWNTSKKEITLKGRPLFNLIGLKKELENHLLQTQETMTTMAEQFDGVFDGQINGYRIPPERQDEANKAIREFTMGTIVINYELIKIGPEDNVPVDILEAIFDFVEMAE